MVSTAAKLNDDIEIDAIAGNKPVNELTSIDKKKALSKKDDEIISDDALDANNFRELNGPGPLRGTSTLLLETRKGQMIFEGRRKKKDKQAIIGLRQFASYLRVIWDAAGNNDPYADWWLLKVEREIEEREAWIEEKKDFYLALLDQFKNMSHEVAHSIAPIERELRFSIPYSFRGAMLLMKHDELTKIIMTANHVGLTESLRSHKDIEFSAKAARTAFQAVTGYRYTGVTRDDVHAMNPKAQKAAELMGPCPSGILDDVVVPKFESTRSLMTRKLRLMKAKAFEQSQKG